jgi:hypothetical protein
MTSHGTSNEYFRSRAVIPLDVVHIFDEGRVVSKRWSSDASIGLMPMAMKLGEGSESYAPLACALIGGTAGVGGFH